MCVQRRLHGKVRASTVITNAEQIGNIMDVSKALAASMEFGG